MKCLRWSLISLLALAAFPTMSFSLGTIDRTVLSNGVVLLTYPRPTLPIVYVSMRLRAGSVFDPAGKTGLSHMVARLLTRGTLQRSAREISEAIDFVGGELGAASDEDYALVTLKVLKKDVALGMDLFSDILLQPAFLPEEIERQRSETLSEIIHDKDDPGKVADKVFSQIVYGGHPYGLPTEGLETTIPGITREDIVRFHETYYRPNAAIVAIVGDVSVEETRALAEKYLGTWVRKDVPPIAAAQLPVPSSPVVKVIDKDLTQANIILGHPGIRRGNPDYYAVFIMNYILGGGGFSSRLLTNIRDERGLAYSVGSAFDTKYATGAFHVSLQTKNSTANEAIRESLREMRKIRQELVRAEELQEAKDYLTGSFPLRLDSNAKIADYLTYVEFHELGLNYFEEFPRRLAAVTREDVLKAARSYLHPETFVLVVVGKEAEAKIHLDEGAPVESR
ncbi:MAG: insulinase family protein [Candidatus Tectomicrobia bacterium]|uniref:Insulinase family protein n=1 Tax=Tectimicrobiota bacterium TaxID=2528274 RepID=A0A932GRJ6_UNCTE|nr:insulinase family protein [Candidatus Tectomicrobia bacterium]